MHNALPLKQTQTETKKGMSGTDVRGFLVSCVFGGLNCSSNTLWLPSTHSAYGNCFTFNARHNEADPGAPRVITQTGILNGMMPQLVEFL